MANFRAPTQQEFSDALKYAIAKDRISDPSKANLEKSFVGAGSITIRDVNETYLFSINIDILKKHLSSGEDKSKKEKNAKIGKVAGAIIAPMVLIGGCGIIVSIAQLFDGNSVSRNGNTTEAWNSHANASILLTPSKIASLTEANEVRFKKNYDNEYMYVKGYVSSISSDGFYIRKGSFMSESSVECKVQPSNRSYITKLNKGDGVVALGSYSFGDFMDLNGELYNCIWSAKPTNNMQAFYSIKWIDTIDIDKARSLIKSSPMFEGTRIRYVEPTRDLQQEGLDALRRSVQ